VAFVTIQCAFHSTDRLLRLTLPRAIRSLTVPTKHDFEVVLVADRSTDAVVHDLIQEIRSLGVDEIRYRASSRHAFSGAPSNNFHGNQFNSNSRYLVSFTDDTFFFKREPGFDVLDAAIGAFEAVPNLAVLSKVDDFDEWDFPLVDVEPQLQDGLRLVNRAVDQFLLYDTERFGPAARSAGAWDRAQYGKRDGGEFQWENMVSSVATSNGWAIGFPEGWPLVVRHCDLRQTPGSMHGTQDEEVKLTVYRNLVRSDGSTKVSPTATAVGLREY